MCEGNYQNANFNKLASGASSGRDNKAALEGCIIARLPITPATFDYDGGDGDYEDDKDDEECPTRLLNPRMKLSQPLFTMAPQSTSSPPSTSTSSAFKTKFCFIVRVPNPLATFQNEVRVRGVNVIIKSAPANKIQTSTLMPL